MNWEITTFIAYFVILLGVALVFYFTAIRKILAESPAKAEAEGKAAEARAEAEFAADAEMETL